MYKEIDVQSQNREGSSGQSNGYLLIVSVEPDNEKFRKISKPVFSLAVGTKSFFVLSPDEYLSVET